MFHLAAVVSGQAEADFDLGMRVNFDAHAALLEVCRARGHRPRVVFASSCAVYGGDLPDVVPPATALTPQSSYGAQKAMGELLVNDYTRRGFVDGRALRLPTISVRPGRPNAALSSFASGIIREPLNGVESVCPVPPATRVWLLSPATVIECFLKAHDLMAGALGANRSLILPGLTVSVGEMVAALERVAGAGGRRRASASSPTNASNGSSAPGRWRSTPRAPSASASPPTHSFDEIIRRYMGDEGVRGS